MLSTYAKRAVVAKPKHTMPNPSKILWCSLWVKSWKPFNVGYLFIIIAVVRYVAVNVIPIAKLLTVFLYVKNSVFVGNDTVNNVTKNIFQL